VHFLSKMLVYSGSRNWCVRSTTDVTD
jgi:hypothetical protein